MSTPHFIKYKTVIEKYTEEEPATDEEGDILYDENGEMQMNTVEHEREKKVADGLLDGYAQITEEEYKACMEAMKPKFN